MTPQQYEVLCRFFVADQVGIGVDEVRTAMVPNPTRAYLHQYCHQIDLYWETWDFLTKHLNIANAKWRTGGHVGLRDVLHLRQVQTKVGAHKAVLITNSSYSPRAESAAEDEGIGLLIMRPDFDYSGLPGNKCQIIQERLQQCAKGSAPLYRYQVIKKGVGPAAAAAPLLGGMFVESGAPTSTTGAGRPVMPPGAPITKVAPPPYKAGWPPGGPPGFVTK